MGYILFRFSSIHRLIGIHRWEEYHDVSNGTGSRRSVPHIFRMYEVQYTVYAGWFTANLSHRYLMEFMEFM